MPASIPNWNDLTEHQRGHILKAAEAYSEPGGAGPAEIASEMFYVTMEAMAAPKDEVAKPSPIRDRLKAIRRAAVAFANDYGPLPAANNGDEGAAHEVATKLFNNLKREGLHIVHSPETKST